MAEIPELSYLVVNTNQRTLLLACLESIFSTSPPFEYEVLVLDNRSTDGSAAAIRDRFGSQVRLIELQQRSGKAENDTRLLNESRGRYALLLNEDTELTPGAVETLHAALSAEPQAGAAGGQLKLPDGSRQPSAWRFPNLRVALAGACFMHRCYSVQSKGTETRGVDWVQSAAMMIRREAFDRVGGLDPRFFVYSDEVDWQKRLRGAGWSVLYVPAAEVVHHEMLGADPSARRVVEFARNRDLYVRKHHGRIEALLVRLLTAWTYAVRAVAALALPGHSPRRYWTHAVQSLLPSRGEGLREAAADFNRTLSVDAPN